ncbi:MAG: peptide-methionine (S)-S-oxide reductase [Chitinophagaceae bacterium]
MEKIGLGGGCHWCTEAVFLSLRGIVCVEQGWIAAEEKRSFSEAIIVYYNPAEINLPVLIGIHLHTHSSTANHSMRNKYRSAIYTFTQEQREACEGILINLQNNFDKPLVTEVLTFHDFRFSLKDEENYYYKNPAKPFCKTHIHPRLKMLLKNFSAHADSAKINSGSNCF